LADLPFCNCNSGKRVTWPNLKSCSVSCASLRVYSNIKIWKRAENESHLLPYQIIEKYDISTNITELQRSVLKTVAEENNIDFLKYQPRQIVLLLKLGKSNFDVCACGSGIEVIPKHLKSPEKFCSNNCSAALLEKTKNIKKTCIEKYGVSNVWARPEILSKLKDKQQQVYKNNIWPKRLEAFLKNGYTCIDKEWRGFKYLYTWTCNKEHEFRACIDSGREPKCPVCWPRISKPQQEIY
jgi:hypothetical protein